MHRVQRPDWPQDGGVPVLGVVLALMGADRDEGFSLLVCEVSAGMQELLDGLYGSPERHDDEGLCSLGRPRVFVRHLGGPGTVVVRGAQEDPPHHEDAALVEEPGEAKGREVLDRHPLLVVDVVSLLHAPVVPGVVLDGLRVRREDPRALAAQNLRAEPVENLAVQAIVAGDGDGSSEESYDPPVDPGCSALEAREPARGSPQQRHGHEQCCDVDPEPCFEEVVKVPEAGD